MKIDLNTLRAIIREAINEYEAPMDPKARGLLNVGPQGAKKGPPPLPKGAPGAKPAPASAALPQKNALGKFKADVNMAVDAANKVQQNIEQANTKEALRWLDKMIGFAQSAKSSLGAK
jgi:hypothetical protein